MKNKVVLFALTFILFASISLAGYIDGSYVYKGNLRKYSIYVPDIYNIQNKKVPLLLGLHGYGDDVANFRNICMSGIADTANYICVYAEGLPFFGANAWNSGAGAGLINVNSNIDDAGFLNGLVDTIIKKYQIDTNRMYVFGFSFGGFMTDKLATEHTNRFAAVANVSGLHGNFLTKLPTKGMPYLKFHGTDDPTINYAGTQTIGIFPGFGLGAEKTVKFWVTQNACDTTPIIDTMPDISNDGLKFVRFTYKNGRDRSDVVFYKVIKGLHKWYGTPTNDISYCQTIWKFFSQYSRASTVTAVINNIDKNLHIKIFPNPSNGIVTLDFSMLKEKPLLINIYNIEGKLMYYKNIFNDQKITLNNILKTGLYIVEVTTEEGDIITQKLVVQ